MEFPRQEYWSEFPFPTPGGLPNTGIQPASLASPWHGDSSPLCPLASLSSAAGVRVQGSPDLIPLTISKVGDGEGSWERFRVHSDQQKAVGF